MKDLIIDCFAGGGGASVGIEMALGRQIDIAINHDPDAIAMHEINHPDTLHLTEDILKVRMSKYLKKGQKVRLLWASPDCTSHSRAKGDKPIKRGLRILPMSVYRLCKQILEVTGYLPEVILMENVAEIQDWGPLDENDKPIKERKGEYYQKFIKLIKNLGYRFDSRELVAADFGAPTTRKRWYAQFRSDGRDITWPEPTHSKGGANGLKPWVPVSTILDFSDLGKSIFGRKKPLADNTMNRIARGMDKFVFNTAEPFIMAIGQTGFSKDRNRSINEPLSTIVTKQEHCLITPVIAPYMATVNHSGAHHHYCNSMDEPFRTITQKNGSGVVSPILIQYHSETRKDEVRGQSVTEPIMTIDTSPRYALALSHLTKFYKSGCGQALSEPLHTITTSPGHFGQVNVLTAEKEEFLVSLNMPIKDQNTQNEIIQKCNWVANFIMEYYGCGTGQSLNEPLHTVVTKDRFALVTIYGIDYVIIDITLRMLTAEELKMAQGFPKDYILDFKQKNGRPYPKSKQVERIGNSVVPIMAEKLALAACPYLKTGERMPNASIDCSQPQLRFA